MKLYLCAIELPNEPGIAFVRFAADKCGAILWQEKEQKFQDTFKESPPSCDLNGREIKNRCRIFCIDAEEINPSD
jgi:hypothetical protein